uniref:Histone H2A/H2B/H3 domain-containing protein n=1 Tax=Ditylenchus dipsaci TaxID=166011 RepID=A0A915DZK4_9BILA
MTSSRSPVREDSDEEDNSDEDESEESSKVNHLCGQPYLTTYLTECRFIALPAFGGALKKYARLYTGKEEREETVVRNFSGIFEALKEYWIADSAHFFFGDVAECYLTALFEDANMIAPYAKRSTILPSDIRLARRIL